MKRRKGKASARNRAWGQRTRHTDTVMNVNSFENDEIGNINMKLELLKKKREVLELHQNLLGEQISYGKGPYDSEIPDYYEQSSYSAPGPSRLNRDFARFYEDPAGEQDYIPLNSGKKRPADESWSRGSAAKRYNSRESGVVQSFGSRLGPRPVPQSQMKPPQAGPSRPPPANIRITTPNVPKKTPAPNDREKYTLRANCEPSTALNGLIELAVGFLLKEMKQKYSNSPVYNRVVTRVYYTRRIKKGLRYRIRELIMNKYVDNYVDIVHEYRKKFPLRTDKKLVQAASQDEIRESPADRKPDPRTEAPRAGMPCPNFFKKNMQRYVKGKLFRMFNEIQEYNLPIKEANTGINDTGDVVIVEDKKKTVRKQPKYHKWKIDIPSLIYDRLRRAIQFHIPTLIRILNMDPEYSFTKANLLATTMNMDPTIDREVTIRHRDDLETVEVCDEPETIEIPDEPETIEVHDDPEPTLYHAKVRGLPNLPPRELMRPFLDEFLPKAIKTHKKMKNLLIVTFCNKDSFDHLLSRDGVSIGGCALDIKGSGKVNPNETQKNEIKENIDTRTDSQASVDSNKQVTVPVEWTQHLNNLIACLRREDEEQAASSKRDTETIPEKSIEHTTESQSESIANEPKDDTARNDITEGTDNLQTTNSDSAVVDTENVASNDNATAEQSMVNEEPQHEKEVLDITPVNIDNNTQNENETT